MLYLHGIDVGIRQEILQRYILASTNSYIYRLYNTGTAIAML